MVTLIRKRPKPTTSAVRPKPTAIVAVIVTLGEDVVLAHGSCCDSWIATAHGPRFDGDNPLCVGFDLIATSWRINGPAQLTCVPYPEQTIVYRGLELPVQWWTRALDPDHGLPIGNGVVFARHSLSDLETGKVPSHGCGGPLIPTPVAQLIS
jgi:hypothetical protein